MNEFVDSARHDDFLRRYTAVQPTLRRYVMAQVPNFQQAEDVLQDIALVLWKKFEGFDGEHSFESWSFGVARHEILHSRRAFARSKLVFVDDINRRLEEKLQTRMPELERRRRQLEYCIDKLPDKQRRLIEMKYYEKMATDAVAAVLKASVNAVRILLCRTRATIASCMERSQRMEMDGERAS